MTALNTSPMNDLLNELLDLPMEERLVIIEQLLGAQHQPVAVHSGPLL